MEKVSSTFYFCTDTIHSEGDVKFDEPLNEIPRGNMRYKISTIEKKSIVETSEWLKDGHSIKFETLWRWGWVEVTTKPDLTTYDEEEGISVFDELEPANHSFWDGFGSDVEYSESMSDSDIEEVEEILEEEGEHALEDAGWEPGDGEVIFRGPLDIEELE